MTHGQAEQAKLAHRNFPLAIELLEAGCDCICQISDMTNVPLETVAALSLAVHGEYVGAMQLTPDMVEAGGLVP